MLHPIFARCFLAGSLLAASAAQAAMAPPPAIAPSDVRPAGETCGFGSRLDASGLCVDAMDYSRRCSPGLFAIPFPNGNGYRCVPGEWQRSSGWLSGLLGYDD